MATRLIVREIGGEVQVSRLWPGHDVPESVGGAVRFTMPLTAAEREELRWYLEDYLLAPYAVYEESGGRIQALLDEWGQRLFASLFGAGLPGRDAYESLRAVGDWELHLASSSPAFLGLPWELLRDPARPTPLALDVPLTRTLDVPRPAFDVPGEALRVLVVIARPRGREDVGYRMIARPLMARLGAVGGQVQLEVLRPPTFHTFQARLREANERGEPFQIVHFDGHGTFGGAAAAGRARGQFGKRPQGYLEFEQPTGGSDPISAADLAPVLEQAGVPLLVFNACRSATLGGDTETGPEAAVATRLLQAGAAAVVAMSYSVYAVGAAEFMAAFYDALFQGQTVARAVLAGRGQMHRADQRPSPKGDLPLDDWIIPVHYGRREVAFPHLKPVPRPGGSIAQRLAQYRAPAPLRAPAAAAGVHAESSLEGEGKFVGRDAEFHELELALRTRHVVVIYGTGGTGKTELAKAFARWLRDTGGLDDPDLVFFHSFEPGVASFGLAGVVAAVGLRLFGPDFIGQVPDATQRSAVILDVLRRHRVLLVWDNFESVFSLPDPTGATPPLAEAERQEIRAFLAEVAKTGSEVANHGRGGVLVTSRSPEEWLGGPELRRLALGGLDRRDQIEHAGQILAGYPRAQVRREERAFEELLVGLEGHPLSMRLLLPHLEHAAPGELVSALRGEAPLPAGLAEVDGGRQHSLAASVHYSLRHLAAEDRARLPALCLFEGVADVDVLRAISETAEAPPRFRNVTGEQWTALLDHCAGIGLLSALGAGMYKLHPALPAYLAAAWRNDASANFGAELTVARRVSIAVHASFSLWLQRQLEGAQAELAMGILGYQRRTMGRAAALALENAQYEETEMILQPLSTYFDAQGLREEARGWYDRCRVAIEGPAGEAPALDTPAGALWLFAVGGAATAALAAGDLGRAEAEYAAIVHRLEGAEGERVHRSLAINYHQLGAVAQERGDSVAAERWYTQSIEIDKMLGDRRGMASSYHQLGMVAQDRGDLNAAERWYTKSLEITEELGARQMMASSYHQLGIVAQRRRDLNAAERWYAKSLEIKVALGDRRGMSSSYHNLGMVAQDRGDGDGAERWYTKSLEIAESLGDRRGMAMSFGQLGLLAEVRRNMSQALEWMVHCVALFPEFPHPATGPGPQHLRRLTHALGMPALEASWRRVTGQPLPSNVRQWVEQPR